LTACLCVFPFLFFGAGTLDQVERIVL
jgi:hypothetical protein